MDTAAGHDQVDLSQAIYEKQLGTGRQAGSGQEEHVLSQYAIRLLVNFKISVTLSSPLNRQETGWDERQQPGPCLCFPGMIHMSRLDGAQATQQSSPPLITPWVFTTDLHRAARGNSFKFTFTQEYGVS